MISRPQFGLEAKNSTAQVEHEATPSKIGEDQIVYFRQRGLSSEDAVNMIVNGFCKQVFPIADGKGLFEVRQSAILWGNNARSQEPTCKRR